MCYSVDYHLPKGASRMTNFIVRVALVFAGIFLLTFGVCEAQKGWTSDLTGRTVRVTAPSLFPKVLEGRAAALSGDTLRLEDCRPNLDLQIIPVSTITRVQVQDGRKGHTLEGVLIGTGVGLAIWGVAELSDDSDEGEFLHGLDENLSKAFLVIFTAGGAVTGGIVGTLIRSDRWRDVPVGDMKVSLVPVAGRRVGLSLAIRF
jgi:hypothetical protein